MTSIYDQFSTFVNICNFNRANRLRAALLQVFRVTVTLPQITYGDPKFRYSRQGTGDGRMRYLNPEQQVGVSVALTSR
jgi:hypothetical protein